MTANPVTVTSFYDNLRRLEVMLLRNDRKMRIETQKKKMHIRFILQNIV